MPDTVSRNRDLHGNSEMTIIGYLIAAVMLVIVLPLLPIIVLLYLIDKLVGRGDRADDQGFTSVE